jgi:hypothetical protein
MGTVHLDGNRSGFDQALDAVKLMIQQKLLFTKQDVCIFNNQGTQSFT